HVAQLAIEGRKQAGEAGRVADVGAVAGRILPDQVQLDRAVRRQLLRLGEHLLDGLGSHRPADARDGAERAALVAPLADPQVSVMPRGEAQTTLVIFKYG